MSSQLIKKCVLFCLVLPLTVVFLNGCQTHRDEDTGRDKKDLVQESGARESQGEETAFWINDTPVTYAQLQRFGNEVFSGMGDEHGHQGGSWKDNPVFLIKPYVRQYALAEEGIKRGILQEDKTRKILEIARLNKIGREYRGFLKKNTPAPPERVDSIVPEEWVQMNFLLHSFDSIDKAQRAYERILAEGFEKRGQVIAEEGGEFSASKKSETGFIFSGSGFFSPFDDLYLFSLEKGDISRPVETGIGLALAEVVERKALNQEEQKAYLERRLSQIVSEYGQKRIEEILVDSDLKTFPEAVERSVSSEMKSGTWGSEVVARTGEIDLTYYQFRRLFTPNFNFYIKLYGMDDLPERVEADILEVSEDVALGVYALTQPEVFQPTGVEGYIEKRKTQVLRSIVQERLYWEDDIKPTEQQVEDYFRGNRDLFLIPAAVKVYTYFTPVPEDINLLWERHEKGIPFEELGEGVKSAEISPHGGRASLNVKQRVVRKGSEDLRPLQETLFSLEPGDIRLLEMDTGFYLVKVGEVVPEKALGYDEVKGRIERNLTAIARKERLEEKIRKLEEQYEIRFNHEGDDTESPPHIDTSLDLG